MLQAIGNKQLQEEFRGILKPFYGVLKTMDGHIRFAMLTGVTKFGKVSVFSDLNNLKDISMLPQYASLCGLTESEIYRYMEEGIQNLAATQHLTYDGTCRKLKVLYDGYHFTPGSEGIYNPFSILRTMDSGIFGSYWFETGTPTYLVTLLKQGKCDLSEISSAVTDVETLDSIYGDDEPIPVIYQSGYLTIKGYNPRFESYTLGFPNKEVEEGFMKFLVPYYTPIRKSATNFEIQKFVREIETGNVDAFMTRLQSFMADTPYELIRDQELHYQNVLFIVSKLLGFYVQAEYRTSQGRIDRTVRIRHAKSPQYRSQLLQPDTQHRPLARQRITDSSNFPLTTIYKIIFPYREVYRGKSIIEPLILTAYRLSGKSCLNLAMRRSGQSPTGSIGVRKQRCMPGISWQRMAPMSVLLS